MDTENQNQPAKPETNENDIKTKPMQEIPTPEIKPEQNQSTTQEKTNQARPEARTNAVNKPSQHKKKTKSGGNQQHKVVLSKEETGERK